MNGVPAEGGDVSSEVYVEKSEYTVKNTITGPEDYIAYLQPSEEATPIQDTNTYYSHITFTKTLQNTESADKGILMTTTNILTQVVVTESMPNNFNASFINDNLTNNLFNNKTKVDATDYVDDDIVAAESQDIAIAASEKIQIQQQQPPNKPTIATKSENVSTTSKPPALVTNLLDVLNLNRLSENIEPMLHAVSEIIQQNFNHQNKYHKNMTNVDVIGDQETLTTTTTTTMRSVLYIPVKTAKNHLQQNVAPQLKAENLHILPPLNIAGGGGGIAIRPGEVITANSDIIIGASRAPPPPPPPAAPLYPTNNGQIMSLAKLREDVVTHLLPPPPPLSPTTSATNGKIIWPTMHKNYNNQKNYYNKLTNQNKRFHQLLQKPYMQSMNEYYAYGDILRPPPQPLTSPKPSPLPTSTIPIKTNVTTKQHKLQHQQHLKIPLMKVQPLPKTHKKPMSTTSTPTTTIGIRKQFLSNYISKPTNRHHQFTAAQQQFKQQVINLDTNVLSHNVNMMVPPLTFKQQADYPINVSPPVHGRIPINTNYTNLKKPMIPKFKIPANEQQIQVQLTPHQSLEVYLPPPPPPQTPRTSTTTTTMNPIVLNKFQYNDLHFKPYSYAYITNTYELVPHQKHQNQEQQLTFINVSNVNDQKYAASTRLEQQQQSIKQTNQQLMSLSTEINNELSGENSIETTTKIRKQHQANEMRLRPIFDWKLNSSQQPSKQNLVKPTILTFKSSIVPIKISPTTKRSDSMPSYSSSYDSPTRKISTTIKKATEATTLSITLAKSTTTTTTTTTKPTRTPTTKWTTSKKNSSASLQINNKLTTKTPTSTENKNYTHLKPTTSSRTTYTTPSTTTTTRIKSVTTDSLRTSTTDLPKIPTTEKPKTTTTTKIIKLVDKSQNMKYDEHIKFHYNHRPPTTTTTTTTIITPTLTTNLKNLSDDNSILIVLSSDNNKQNDEFGAAVNDEIQLDYDESITFEQQHEIYQMSNKNLVNDAAIDMEESGEEILLGGVLISRTTIKPTKLGKWTASTLSVTPLIEASNCTPSCKEIRNEMCAYSSSEYTERHTKECLCRRGFARMFPERPCKRKFNF